MDIFERLGIKIHPGKSGCVSENFFKTKEFFSEKLKNYTKSEDKITLAVEIERLVLEGKYEI